MILSLLIISAPVGAQRPVVPDHFNCGERASCDRMAHCGMGPYNMGSDELDWQVDRLFRTTGFGGQDGKRQNFAGATWKINKDKNGNFLNAEMNCRYDGGAQFTTRSDEFNAIEDNYLNVWHGRNCEGNKIHTPKECQIREYKIGRG